MTTKRRTKFVHEGQYAAEVEIRLVESDAGRPPYLCIDDALKLDDVREALRRAISSGRGNSAGSTS